MDLNIRTREFIYGPEISTSFPISATSSTHRAACNHHSILLSILIHQDSATRLGRSSPDYIRAQRKSLIFPYAFTMELTISVSDIAIQMQEQLQCANPSAEELPLHKICDHQLSVLGGIQATDLLDILPQIDPHAHFDPTHSILDGVKSCVPLWTCCYCGMSGQTTWQTGCPNCGHQLCVYCETYTPKR